MTWQGAGGTDGGTGDPDDATRTDWATAAQPADPAPLPPAPSTPPQPEPTIAPPPAPGPGAPLAPGPGAPLAPEPWAPVQPGNPWGTPPPDGGGRYAVPGAPGLIYAGAIPRAAAWIVDGFLVGIVASIVSAPFAAPVALDANGAPDFTQMAAQGGVSAIISTVIGAAYFILLWTTSGRATLGMRLFNLQVGNVADGTKLRMDQALKRWIGFGTWLGIIPLVGLFSIVWELVLLATTVSSPTKQGLHDRFAGSAVVRPASAGNGLAITCLVLALILPILALFSIVALILLGGQVSSILSAVGDSV
jgi:uncharacterized RDD family membrane protein YckC